MAAYDVNKLRYSSINELLSSPPMWRLRTLFPELTEREFTAVLMYSMGISNQKAASLRHVSECAIKQQLKRSKEALDVDEMATLRILFNCRMMVGLYATHPPAAGFNPGL